MRVMRHTGDKAHVLTTVQHGAAAQPEYSSSQVTVFASNRISPRSEFINNSQLTMTASLRDTQQSADRLWMVLFWSVRIATPVPVLSPRYKRKSQLHKSLQ